MVRLFGQHMFKCSIYPKVTSSRNQDNKEPGKDLE